MSLTTFITTSVVPAARLPVAAFSANPAFGVVGSVVKLDGRLSSDPDQKPLFYTWSFISVPIGSQVRGEGFRTLDADTDTGSPALVSFSPDVVGEYVVGLTVSNGVFDSSQMTSNISIRAILIPHGRGIIPDGKFIWTFIRDVWSQVDGKEFFETLWSALIQITGSEMLKLYQVDFNKSIRDIQDRYQRRWLSYEPKLLLDNVAHSPNPLSFYFGNHCAGQDASTVNLGLEGQAVILASNEVIVVLGARLQNVTGETLTILYSLGPGNVGQFALQGLNASRNGYKLVSSDLTTGPDTVAVNIGWAFAIGDTHWQLISTGTLPPLEPAVTLSEWAPFSDTLLPLFRSPSAILTAIKKGDVIHYPSGPNAGFYRIVEKSGSFITVDHAPPSFSNNVTPGVSNVYRPVGFKVTQPAVPTTNTFSVPYTPGANDISVLATGRIVVVNGRAHTIVRAVVDQNQLIPLVVVTVDSDDLVVGLRNLTWRAPPTAISTSQDFGALGVETGDLLGFDVVLEGTELISEVVGQVVGVKDGAFGFVFTDGPVEPGKVPPVPNKTIQKLATDFGIDGVSVSQDGTLVLSGTALAFSQSINSGTFKKAYWNQPLTPDSDISVNPTFQLKPAYVIRNRLVPVDSELRSVPTLQEWIVQPTVSERNGKFYQSVRGQEFEIPRRPVVLTENLEFLIDDEFAFVGQMTINTGSDLLQIDDADFVDRNIVSGDLFIIESPLTLNGTYIIEEVISNTQIRLNRSVPNYVLGAFANARVTLQRNRTGHFLRFVPGLFDAQHPAPDRIWAEVSFFDNNPTVENNFGILVGLKKETLDSVSRDINYRQAVSGLMFAFTRGSALDKVRLGAQILLGLPFAENRGIVRSIEPDYRLDVNGTPILGRLLIEDIDSTGAALGTLRIYLYPIDLASALAGIDTNPATGKPYAVDDTVELFAPLSKGVEIIDYITNPLDSNFSSIAQLQKFHAVRLRANDNIFSLEELALVSEFLRKITPSYIAYSLTTDSEFADTVNIQDLLFEGLAFGDGSLVDNASLRIAPTLMLNSRNADGLNQMNWDQNPNWIRRYGLDGVSVSGGAPGLPHFTSAAGGFINPKTHEVFQAPLTKVGDLLVIFNGQVSGSYSIQTVVSDNEVIVSGPTGGFPDEVGLQFMIARAVTGFLTNATVGAVSGSSSALVAGGGQLRTQGVTAGDFLVLNNGTVSYKHLIKTVRESIPGSGIWDTVDVTPNVEFNNAAAPATIWRPPLLPSLSCSLTSTGGNDVVMSAGGTLQDLLNIGDEFVLATPGLDRLTILDPLLDRATNKVYVTPALPAGTYVSVGIFFKGRVGDVGGDRDVGWDHIEKFDPIDELTMGLVESVALASCTATMDTVTFQVQRTIAPAAGPFAYDPQAGKVLPGDLLVLTSGANSAVDVGHGPGVYPIVEVSSTNVRLSHALGSTESDSWQIVRRR